MKAFAESSAILSRPDYADVARRNAEFLLRELWREGKLLRTHKDGQSKLNGYLEDYAHLIDGLLALYQVTFELPWFKAASELAALTRAAVNTNQVLECMATGMRMIALTAKDAEDAEDCKSN